MLPSTNATRYWVICSMTFLMRSTLWGRASSGAFKNWDRLPHFSTAYFDENEEKTVLIGVYGDGFYSAHRRTAQARVNQLLGEPDFKVNPPFFSLAQEDYGC